jgi:hypothetical protein
MALQSNMPKQIEYLLRTKGKEEVDRRVVFLGI